MTAVSLKSEYLQRTFDINIYLPPHFSSQHKYHLAIANDGRDYFQMGKVARLMETLYEKEGARPTIIAGVPYPSADIRRTWYDPDGSDYEAYSHFFVEELLPFLDESYPTWRLPHGRTLMGDSLAATFALIIATSYPKQFSRVILQSPYVSETVLSTLQHTDVWKNFEIYHSIGKEETNVNTSDGRRLDFVTPNRQLKEIIQSANRYHYTEFDGDHTWTYWQDDLADALRFMFTND